MEYIERYWRDATPEDAIREPPMVARFKTDDPGPVRYIIDKLVGVIRTNAWMWRTANGGYLHCQVYDAPDPGEGWRLIDTKYEQPQEGDEFLLTPRNEWITIAEHPSRGFRGRGFAESYIYRRRIEQPKPEPKTEPKYAPFEWEDREQLRGRWVIDGAGDEQCIARIEKYKHSFCVNGIPIEKFLWAWRFIDTGEPVGKRVL